jgi:hypothetical protein
MNLARSTSWELYRQVSIPQPASILLIKIISWILFSQIYTKKWITSSIIGEKVKVATKPWWSGSSPNRILHKNSREKIVPAQEKKILRIK